MKDKMKVIYIRNLPWPVLSYFCNVCLQKLTQIAKKKSNADLMAVTSLLMTSKLELLMLKHSDMKWGK
jgi:hypothetical protein